MTANIERVLNDCLAYGEEPQTFSREIVKRALAELNELKLAARDAAFTLRLAAANPSNHPEDRNGYQAGEERLTKAIAGSNS